MKLLYKETLVTLQ